MVGAIFVKLTKTNCVVVSSDCCQSPKAMCRILKALFVNVKQRYFDELHAHFYGCVTYMFNVVMFVFMLFNGYLMVCYGLFMISWMFDDVYAYVDGCYGCLMIKKTVFDDGHSYIYRCDVQVFKQTFMYVI
jgi:hypothetical protein